MSSLVTLSDLKRITAPRLAEQLLAKAADPSNDEIAIVDVRDDDHIGGHIAGSLHFPSQSLDATMPTLLRKLERTPVVVFHCALSQQRGPGAALRYMRERAELVEREKQKQEKGRKTEEGKAAESEVNEGEAQKDVPKQTVYVLDRGFVGWQEVFGTDERLTEGYRTELWKDGYWG